MRKQPVKLTLCFVVFPASPVEKIMKLLKLVSMDAVPMAAIILR